MAFMTGKDIEIAWMESSILRICQRKRSNWNVQTFTHPATGGGKPGGIFPTTSYRSQTQREGVVSALPTSDFREESKVLYFNDWNKLSAGAIDIL